MSKPRLRRIEDIIDRPNSPYPVALRQYEVSVDGVVMGTVAQERSDSTHGYAGSALGFTTTRTTWRWETQDNCGNYEMRTRTEAVEDLVDFQATRTDR